MQKMILMGSNDGIACEVLAVSDDSVLIHNTAMTAKLAFEIVVSVAHYGNIDGPAPAVGFKFNRPANAPLETNLNQKWNKKELQEKADSLSLPF